jgi:hypothetical protein
MRHSVLEALDPIELGNRAWEGIYLIEARNYSVSTCGEVDSDLIFEGKLR